MHQPKRALPSSDRQCFYCHLTGHVIADCVSLNHKQQPPQAKQAKGVGVIKAVSPSVPLVRLGRPEEPDECFKPFIFDGFVSLTGLVEDQRPVKILRDTASSQRQKRTRNS